MHKLVRITVYTFVVIIALTALLTLVGIALLWFDRPDTTELPYLKWLFISVIAEIAGVVLVVAKKGLNYLPDTISNKKELETLKFMSELVSSGSSVTIVSNRISWLRRSNDLLEAIKKKAASGTLIEIITPGPVEEDIRSPLSQVGVHFYETRDAAPPQARFTLINANRSGAERLAISRGIHPDHEITIFDSTSGPQIIGMAKDIVRRSKEAAGAA